MSGEPHEIHASQARKRLDNLRVAIMFEYAPTHGLPIHAPTCPNRATDGDAR